MNSRSLWSLLPAELHSRHGETGLLMRLAHGGVFAGLALFDLAGRKLPGERSFRDASPHEQDTPALNDDGGGNRCRGLDRHGDPFLNANCTALRAQPFGQTPIFMLPHRHVRQVGPPRAAIAAEP